MMHSRGINMRYLGRLTTESKFNHIRELAVIEILSRCIKVLIKDGMTFLSDEDESMTSITVLNLKKTILHYFNEIFNNNEQNYAS